MPVSSIKETFFFSSKLMDIFVGKDSARLVENFLTFYLS